MTRAAELICKKLTRSLKKQRKKNNKKINTTEKLTFKILDHYSALVRKNIYADS